MVVKVRAGPRHSQGGLYGDARIEGGRISAAGGKFWAKIRILWGIASGASGFRPPPQAEIVFENDAFKEKIYYKTFDVVLCTAAMEYFTDPQATFAEV